MQTAAPSACPSAIVEIDSDDEFNDQGSLSGFEFEDGVDPNNLDRFSDTAEVGPPPHFGGDAAALGQRGRLDVPIILREPRLKPVILEPEHCNQKCLETVLELFPDVLHRHVLDLYEKYEKRLQSKRTKEDHGMVVRSVIEALADANKYPKEAHKSLTKRKRAADSDEEDGTLLARNQMPTELSQQVRRLKWWRQSREVTARQARHDADAEATKDRECAEGEEVVECQCCFTDTPLTKITWCTAEHPFCYDCGLQNARAQIDLGRYRLHCMDGSGCQQPFSFRERSKFLDKQVTTVLDRLEQHAVLREVDLPNLEHCPFCDFACECPPVEEDPEFKCQVAACKIVSCRLCKHVTHLPKSCDEYRKDKCMDQRHIVEEEMTKALLRECPKCKVSIYKTEGCNKLTCSQCDTRMCDICGKDITEESYNHFFVSGCRLIDDTVARNHKKVQEAEKAARTRIAAENPDIVDTDLELKFSDTAKAASPYAEMEAPIRALDGLPILELAEVGIPLELLQGHRVPWNLPEQPQPPAVNFPWNFFQPLPFAAPPTAPEVTPCPRLPLLYHPLAVPLGRPFGQGFLDPQPHQGMAFMFDNEGRVEVPINWNPWHAQWNETHRRANLATAWPITPEQHLGIDFELLMDLQLEI